MLPSSQAELFSIESLVQATYQQSELITWSLADGAASKEVSAVAAASFRRGQTETLCTSRFAAQEFMEHHIARADQGGGHKANHVSTGDIAATSTADRI